MSPSDIYSQFKEYGPSATAFGTAGLTLLGAGGSTFDDELAPKQKVAILLGEDPKAFEKKSASKGSSKVTR